MEEGVLRTSLSSEEPLKSPVEIGLRKTGLNNLKLSKMLQIDVAKNISETHFTSPNTNNKGSFGHCLVITSKVKVAHP